MFKTNNALFVLACSLVSECVGTSGSFRYIPFSTKYPELIIPSEKVCLPRITCQSNQRSVQISARNQDRQPFTDFLNSQDVSDVDAYTAGPVDLPQGYDEPDQLVQEDDPLGPQAVTAEIDNYLLDQSEQECKKDKLDFCVNDYDYRGPEHTMCTFCGIGPACPLHIDQANNDLTGRLIVSNQIKELIVQLHNEVRSKIARGACDQPKAGCMGPVVWDDELARVAQKWSDQCADVDYKGDYKRQDPLIKHDKHPHRKVAQFSDWQGVGQNVARDITPGTRGEFNVTNLVGHWFRQIRLWDPAGVESFGSGEQCSRGVGYYTQMVWQNTTHVGCGWTQFQYRGFEGYFENFLVCNYGPSGNIGNDPVYDIAETPCDCPCVDCDQEEGMCPSDPRFGFWAGWSRWGECSKTCGGGVKRRTRECEAPRADGNGTEPCGLCPGEREENESCNDWKCPYWSEWAPWSQCSATCAEGERTRQRSCEGQQGGELELGLPCDGPSTEREACDAGPCPAWTPWTPWTSCSATCGGGSKNRIRECRKGRNYDECEGEPEETETCGEDKCPEYTEWTDWTPCTKSCGGGRRTKVRTCTLPLLKSGEYQCEGESEVTEDCNAGECPNWSEWTPWTQCTKTCGGGRRTKVRTCALPDLRSGEPQCEGEAEATEDCNSEECPKWSEWTPWTECSATCGGGQQARQRDCLLNYGKAGSNEFGCEGEADETTACNEQSCPDFSPWSDWSECSVTCGGGMRSRERHCEADGETVCTCQCFGPIEEFETCNYSQCPEWSEWGEWSSCSLTCGEGTQTRVRRCTGEGECPGEAIEARECKDRTCPAWDEWGEWSQCSASCGQGTRDRVRTCGPGARYTDTCPGDSSEVEPCDGGTCYGWSQWQPWSQCSVTCGLGGRSRERTCGALTRDSDCEGEDTQEEQCDAGSCSQWTPWGSWSPCSATCGAGITSRKRTCQGGGTCPGEAAEQKECESGSGPCLEWSPWGSWTSCSASCGSGRQSRERKCQPVLDFDFALPDPENPIEDIDLPDGNSVSRPTLLRLGLLTGKCPGAGQDSRECQEAACSTQPPLVSEECDGEKMPTKFFAFNGRPATNVADCTWDFFGCSRKFSDKCCKSRFNDCCMYVMNPTTTTPRPFGGYGPPPEPAKTEIGPEIVDNNLNIENPLADIDQGDGQLVTNPNNLVSKCEEAAARSRDTAAHPSDCGKFVSCQAGARSGSWIATVRACSPGTVWDEQIGECNFRENVPGCQQGRRGRVMTELFDATKEADGTGQQFAELFQEVNTVFARQTHSRLGVSESLGSPIARPLVSSARPPSGVLTTVTSLLGLGLTLCAMLM